MISPASRWIYAVSTLLVAMGFLLPFWPVSVAGILLCGLSGRVVGGIFLGLLLDLAWGAPTGTAHLLFFPMTALAIASLLLRYFGMRYVLDRAPQEHL